MDHQNQTERPGRGRILIAAGLLCFTAASIASLSFASSSSSTLPAAPLGIATTPLSDGDNTNDHRELSIALPHGGCQVTYAHLTDMPITQTWQASFPGSGSRMTWSLVEALTGIRTNDDYDSHDRGYEKVVAVKTHYPVKDARRRFKDLDKKFGRAMVILRNPINAIPSYFNLQYEHLNHLPNHSTRGPTEDWIQYRNDYFLDQIENFENFVEYWMEKYPERSNLLMLSYEDLTNDFLGTIAATRIADFLGESENVNPIARESIPCVWDTIVNYKNAGPPPDMNAAPEEGVDVSRKLRQKKESSTSAEEGGIVRQREENTEGRSHPDPSSLRLGPKVRPYTEQNLMMMVAMFQRLVDKYFFDEDFVRIMVSYIETVSNTVPSQE